MGEDRKFLLELDVPNFVKVLENDKLNITHENVLTELVLEYIKLRVDAKTTQERPPAETVKPELWALLDDSEKANRQAQYEARLAEKEAAKTAKREEDSKVYQGLDAAGRIQMILDLQQEQRNKEIEAHHSLKPLNDDDKK